MKIMQYFRRFLDLIANFIAVDGFPCIFCSCEKTDEKFSICEKCLSKLERAEELCPICGMLSENNVICTECAYGRSFNRAFVPFLYKGKIREGIVRLKFNNEQYLAKHLGIFISELLVDKFDEIDEIDFVVPVPLSKKRKKNRGYNQAELLAKVICEDCNLSLNTEILLKTVETKKQSKLNKLERQKNIKNAFSCVMPEMVKGKNILLVDDVITTGATCNECAKVLKDAGAEKIFVAALAITDTKNNR